MTANAHAIRYEVFVGTLPEAGMPIRFAADPRELEALARQLRIPTVRSLEADVLVSRWRGEGVKVTGRLVAAVVQTCVVTLEPLEERVEEEIEALFVPEGSRLARVETGGDEELHIDPEGADAPDTFAGDRIDLGALFCETTALGLDPYPRKPGATLDGQAEGGEGEEERLPSPFAALAALRPKGGTEI